MVENYWSRRIELLTYYAEMEWEGDELLPNRMDVAMTHMVNGRRMKNGNGKCTKTKKSADDSFISTP